MKNLIYLIAFISINCMYGQNSNSFSYDALFQFNKIIKTNGTTISYQYDEVGNRIGMIVTNNLTTDFSNNILQLGVKLYPNPTSESFCISGFEDYGFLRLTDISGKLILAKQVSNNEIISIGSLAKGIYIVELITKKGVIEKKLLKK